MGCGGGQTSCVMYEKKENVIGIDAKNILTYEELTGTLSTVCGGTTNRNIIGYQVKKNVTPLRSEVTRMKNSNGLGVGEVGGPCPTLTTMDIHSVFYEAYQHNGYRESDTSRTLTTDQNNSIRGDTPLIVRTDRRTFEENQHGGYKETEINGTLRASGGAYGGGSETLVTERVKTQENTPNKPKSILDILKKAVQRIEYIIRRLTPVECERLQGFPDDWTKYGADGTEIADTARYRAIGNSICVYCAERVYLGILDALQEVSDERKDESIL